MSELRYFTVEGRTRWNQWLDELRLDSTLALPAGLLTNPDFSCRAPTALSVDQQLFASKFEMAERLAPVIASVREARLPGDRWPGLWDWLAAFYFDSLCPLVPAGHRELREQARYSFSADYKRRYRHRIFGPIDLYLRLGSYSRVLIHGAPSSLTDWEEQTASRYQISSNRGIAEALYLLYWDEDRNAPKRGAAPNARKPGTLRRFSDLVQQLGRTYDLMSVDATAILALLPSEFKAFKPA
jgi:hypothetical protein